MSVAIAVCLFCALQASNLNARQDKEPAEATRQASTEASTVLSARQLEAPLRGGHRRVVFSPDGKYLLAQDDGGITLFTREPFRVKVNIRAMEELPAAFTADSQSVVLADKFMNYHVLSVEGKGSGEPREVSPEPQECIDTILSPAGNALVCLDIMSKIHIYDVPSGKEVAEIPANSGTNLPILLFANISVESAFSEPFGMMLGPSGLNRGPGAFGRAILQISPDGHYLLIQTPMSEMQAFDLKRDQKINLPGSLKFRTLGAIDFISADKAAVMDLEKPGNSEILGFPGGEKLGKPDLAGTMFGTSSANYTIYASPHDPDPQLMDMTKDKFVCKLQDFASDVWGQEIATYGDDGNLEISNFDGTKLETVPIEAKSLSKLSAASATPDLEGFVMGTGEAAAFNAGSGKRVATFERVRGAWCANSTECYVEVLSKKVGSFDVKKVNLSNGSVETIWTHAGPGLKDHSNEEAKESGFYEPSGSVILQQASSIAMVNEFGTMPHLSVIPQVAAHEVSMLPFILRALDFQSGSELWERKFDQNPPVPFSDPQGDRVVLGWSADSDGARKAAKSNAVAEKQLKAEKKKSHDIYFEVLDARTGKTLGGALVESNSAADTFDEAFSEGDWLVLARDGQRVIVESLSTGREILRLRGWMPTIHAANAMLCLSPEASHLDLYDLISGQKMKDYRFPAPIAYAKFSADGKKLLAVTQNQFVLVLDVGKVRKGSAAAAE